MKARYIGEEAAFGTKETKLFGITVRCGEVFEVPVGFETKARGNAFVEVLPDAPPRAVVTSEPAAEALGPDPGLVAATPTTRRKKQAKDA